MSSLNEVRMCRKARGVCPDRGACSHSGAVHKLVQLELLTDQRAHVVGGGLVRVRVGVWVRVEVRVRV